jgi:hypothetical protein
VSFPLGTLPQVPIESRCFFCHSSAEEFNLGHNPCCNLPVCDNGHEYDFASYSRDFCRRSHGMYTSGTIISKEDMRETGENVKFATLITTKMFVRLFSTTNGWKDSPTSEQNLLRGSFLTDPCSGSDNRFLPGHDSSTCLQGCVFCGKCKAASSKNTYNFSHD